VADETVLKEGHKKHKKSPCLKGLSYEIDFENFDEKGPILAFKRAAAGF
jgi:hypothetical protein